MAGFYQTADAICGFTATKPDLSDYVTIDIGAPGGKTYIYGIGPEGTLVGAYCDLGECPEIGPEARIRAFLRKKLGAVSVWEYPGRGGRFTRFRDINGRGQILGDYLDPWAEPAAPPVLSGFPLNRFDSDPIPILYPDPAYSTIPNGINCRWRLSRSMPAGPVVCSRVTTLASNTGEPAIDLEERLGLARGQRAVHVHQIGILPHLLEQAAGVLVQLLQVRTAEHVLNGRVARTADVQWRRRLHRSQQPPGIGRQQVPRPGGQLRLRELALARRREFARAWGIADAWRAFSSQLCFGSDAVVSQGEQESLDFPVASLDAFVTNLVGADFPAQLEGS
jgi:hypothetical protein